MKAKPWSGEVVIDRMLALAGFDVTTLDEARIETLLRTKSEYIAKRRRRRRMPETPVLTDLQRIGATLDAVDRKARERDDAPRLAALRTLAPYIAQARSAAEEIDAHAKAHAARFDEIRAVLSRPALSRIMGTDRKQMIEGTRGVAQEIADFYANAEALRRDAKRAEDVDTITLGSRPAWVQEQSTWLEGLAVGTLRALPGRWRTLEESVTRIAAWLAAEDVNVSDAAATLPRVERPAPVQTHAISAKAARA